MKRGLACVLLLALVGCDTLLTKPSLYATMPTVVTRRNGEPVPGATVTLYTGARPMGYGTTGADGRFVFTRVPPGTYGVVVTPPEGYGLIEELTKGPVTNVVDGITIWGSTPPEAHFHFLKRGPGAIALSVTGLNGTALAGLPVVLEGETSSVATTTDVAGAARFDPVPYGLYQLTVTRPFVYGGSYYRDFVTPSDSSYAVRSGIVVDEGVEDSIDIALPSCTGTVNLLVLDELNAPVPSIPGALLDGSATLNARSTAADGRAHFNAPCVRPLQLRIDVPSGFAVAGGASNVSGAITLLGGQATDVVFHLRHTS